MSMGWSVFMPYSVMEVPQLPRVAAVIRESNKVYHVHLDASGYTHRILKDNTGQLRFYCTWEEAQTAYIKRLDEVEHALQERIELLGALREEAATHLAARKE